MTDSADKPDLVYDEPVATGWLRTELFGDTNKATGFIRDARRLLGHVRTVYGVNDRIAHGEAGGFYYDRRTLSDGTQIEAITNNGMDTIRVVARSGAEVPAVDKELEERTGKNEYLWVGIKRVSGGGICANEDPETGSFPTIHLTVWEPDSRTAREAGRPAMILSGRKVEELTDYDEVVYPLQDTPFILVDAIDQYGEPMQSRVNYTNNGMYHTHRELAYDPHDPTAQWDQVIVMDPSMGDGVLINPETAIFNANQQTPPQVFPDMDTDDRGRIELPVEIRSLGDGYQIGVVVEHDPCSAPTPVNLLLEVRAGKAPYQVVTQYEFTITHYAFLQRDLYPYGFFQIDGSSDDFYTGPNPHHDGWWPTTVTVDPEGAISDTDSPEGWPRGFDRNASRASRQVFCGTRRLAQVTWASQTTGDAGDPPACENQLFTQQVFIQVFGYPAEMTELFGHDVMRQPCTGLPPPNGTAITGQWTEGGGTYTWAGIAHDKPRNSGVVADGYQFERELGPEPYTGTWAVCFPPDLVGDAGFAQGDLEFHYWWDEDGFHTAPGPVPG